MKNKLMIPIVASLMFGGCAMAVNTGIDIAPGVDLTGYTSFEWDTSTGPDATGDPRFEGNPFVDWRLRDAIQLELFARGVEQEATGPRLIVDYQATVQDQVEVYADASHSVSEYGEGTRVLRYEQGTFWITLIDAETRVVLWRGWAQFDVTSGLSDALVMEDLVDQVVERIFEGFPDSVT